MTFRKGQSGNPGGRGSDKLFRDNLMLSLKEADGKVQKIRRITDALVAKAIDGDTRAITLIAERIDGRASNEETQNEPDAIFGRAVSAVDELIERAMAEHSAPKPAPKPA